MEILGADDLEVFFLTTCVGVKGGLSIVSAAVMPNFAFISLEDCTVPILDFRR